MKTMLIAALALVGSTTAALAQPGPVVRDHREPVTVTTTIKTNVRPVVKEQPVVATRGRERGHGPVVHNWDPRPVVVTRPIVPPPVVVRQPVVYTPPIYQPPVYQPSQLSLASDIQLYGAQFINLDRTLQNLTLSADRGSTDIQAIQITFANGDVKTFNYNEMLDGANPSLTVSLGGRNVDNIVVFGHAASYGAQLDVTAGC